MKALVPTRALGLLMLIGFADLVTTAWLHAQGLITEMNPLMRVFIEQSEWLFVFVKGMTLVCAWAAMAHYAKTNPLFVRNICLAGSAVYVLVWSAWFFSAH